MIKVRVCARNWLIAVIERLYREVLSPCTIVCLLIFCSPSCYAVLDPEKSESPRHAYLTNLANSHLTQARNMEQTEGLSKKTAHLYRSAGAAFMQAGLQAQVIPPMLKYFEFLGSNEPESPYLHVTLLLNFTDALIAEGQVDLAKEYLEKLREAGKKRLDSLKYTQFSCVIFEARLALLEGDRLTYLSRIDELIERVFELIHENPRHYSDGSKQLMRTLFDAGDFDKYLEFRRAAHQKTIQVFGNNPNADLRNGLEEIKVLKLMGRSDEARDKLEALLNLPDLPESIKSNLVGLLGDIQVELGDYHGAVETFTAASKLNTQKNYELIMAFAKAKLGDTKDAEMTLNKAIEHYETYMKRSLDKMSKAAMTSTIAKVAVELGQIETARKYNDESESVYDLFKVLGEKRYLVNHQILLDIANKSNQLNDWINAEEKIYPFFADNRNTQVSLLFNREHRELLMKMYSILLRDTTKREKYSQRAFLVVEKLTNKPIESAVQSAYLRSKVANSELTKLIHKRDYFSSQLSVNQHKTERAKQLGDQIKAITQELISFPEIKKLNFVEQPDLLAQVQRKLRATSAVIKYVPTLEHYYVLLVTEDKVLFKSVQAKPDQVESLVQQLRDSIEPLAGAIIPEYDYKAANKLYELLLSPLEAELQKITHLNIVPDDSLLSVPFSALQTASEEQDSWLFKKYDISVSPTVSSIIFLAKDQPRVHKKQFLGIGDPIYATTGSIGYSDVSSAALQRGAVIRQSGLVQLTDTRKELESIANFFGASASDLLLGADANERRLFDQPLDDYQYISFATHGLLSSENDTSEPGLMLSAPQGNQETLDGILSSSEIMGMNINADLVFLSACNTSGTNDSGKFKGLAGLSSSFLFAGAKSLVVSNWVVESESAAYIMINMAKKLTDTRSSPSNGLKVTISELLTRQDLEKWHHPFYWAPFFVVGAH